MKNLSFDTRLCGGESGGINDIGGGSDYTKEDIMAETKGGEVQKVVERGGNLPFEEEFKFYMGSRANDMSSQEISDYLEENPGIEEDIIKGIIGDDTDVGSPEWILEFEKRNR